MPHANHQPTGDLITVLGATGGIGRAIVDELMTTPGRRVRAVSRSATTSNLPAAVETHDADMMDPAGVKEACADAAVIVMSAQPPYPRWASDWPTMLDSVIEATAATGARLVFVDNLYAYAPAQGVITERSPEHATDTKGKLRAQMGQQLLAAHRDGRIRVTIGRFTDYFGPGASNSGLSMLALNPAAKGKTMRAMFDLDQPHAFHYLPDAAACFVRMIDSDAGDGDIWILPTTPAKTQREVFAIVNDLLPKPVRVGRVGPLAMRIGGLFDPMIRESRSVQVQFDRPWEVDGSAFEETYGAAPRTDLRQALQATLAHEMSYGGLP
ncbi:NAD-dependent epimerase/dehydratase family protein [Euzebya tangerina]|uniref:NAD-dependent epimerase/dehydratase family protein n=1 Tax=Euzebya tangerina TaxID=591198 RepID=UPI000E3195E7|nr:NAD-dependent epimerase/dehydratase family protein [Euzebya tangerina]